MSGLAYLNGRFLPLDEATVSVEDRGFQFGDGVYEVVRVYGGVPFRAADHFVRFERSAEAIALPFPLSLAAWERALAEGIDRSRCDEGKVYMQLTRGAAPREHTFPRAARPTFLMTFQDAPAPEAGRRDGVSAITLPDVRWGRCSVKSLNLLPNILARQAASEAGAYEAILIRQGMVTEGAASNVCLVRHGRLVTPALSDRLLAGVTRAVVLALATQRGIGVEERDVREEELSQADELFLIGTTIEVLPVTRLNGAPVGAGTLGAVTQELSGAFRRCVASETRRPRA